MAVRIAAFVIPILIAYVVIRISAPWLYRPDGWFGLAIWIVQATAIGAVVSRGIARLTRRMLPLATLLTTTLVFPDQAPSRFGVALRAGTVKQMRRRAQELQRDGLGSTAAEAAENAVVLVTGLGRHDRLTRGHTERVRAYADLIAQELHFSETERNWLAWGVLLHDVGKMTVPPEILNKAERLTDEEWGILKNHPAAGAKMLLPLAPWLGDWVLAAGEHHERWDGRGYPAGLEGSEISLAGRITAVADAYDVITSKRSYKEPMSVEAARQELVDCAGSQFDPAIVRAFLSVSIGRSRAVGSLAWLTELPIVRGALAVGSSPVAAAAGAAVVAAAAVMGLGDDSASRRSAFAAELQALSNDSIPAVVVEIDPAEAGATPSSTVVIDRTDPGTTPEPTTTTPPKVPASSTTVDPTAPSTTEPAAPSLTTPTGTTPTNTVATNTTTPANTVPTGSTTPTTTTAPSSTTSPDPVVTVPSVTVSSVSTPVITVPSISTPPISTPVVTVPSVSTPSISLPIVIVPSLTTPPITVPSITVPSVTTPLVTLPPVTIPTLTLPPLGGLFG